MTKKPKPNPKDKFLSAWLKQEQITPTEDQIQITFVEYVKHVHPDHFPLLIHIANEGARGLAGGVRQKRLGLKPGVPDLFLAMPKRLHVFHVDGDHEEEWVYHGLWIELKRRDGRISKSQMKMMQALAMQDYWVEVCYSLDSAIKVFERYIDTNDTLTLKTNTEDIAPSEPA